MSRESSAQSMEGSENSDPWKKSLQTDFILGSSRFCTSVALEAIAFLDESQEQSEPFTLGTWRGKNISVFDLFCARLGYKTWLTHQISM